ncbi:MAG: hypothetical protein EBZ17_04245 [Actinobacteria bacterium]|nr:hypothetical protein [Actinomycetota bacterium]
MGNRPGRSIDERGRKVEGDLHVGEMVLDRLVRTDRFAELMSLGDVLDRGLEEATGHADALGGRAERSSIEGEIGVGAIKRIGSGDIGEDAETARLIDRGRRVGLPLGDEVERVAISVNHGVGGCADDDLTRKVEGDGRVAGDCRL